jgi:predicted transposase YbfD/YdcC
LVEDEITAIPKLLEILEVSGCLVTIDAMGCQVEIAEKIVEAKADYVLAVKGNQPTLHAGIEAFFLDHLEDDFARVSVGRHEKEEKGHGRAETRSYLVCEAPGDLPDRARWKGLKGIGVAIGETIRDGKSVSDVRSYILSRKLSGKAFAAAVRSHWAIENSCHWSLDVTFGEDQSRIRKGHADANFSILRRTALGLLKSNHDLKVGIKNKRLAAGWDDSYLEQVLFGSWLMVQSPCIRGRRCRRAGRDDVGGRSARMTLHRAHIVPLALLGLLLLNGRATVSAVAVPEPRSLLLIAISSACWTARLMKMTSRRVVGR